MKSAAEQLDFEGAGGAKGSCLLCGASREECPKISDKQKEDFFAKAEELAGQA
jgi:hypothetical protein